MDSPRFSGLRVETEPPSIGSLYPFFPSISLAFSEN
jgi:hypothetical protein